MTSAASRRCCLRSAAPAIPQACERFRHHWISIGQLGRAMKLFRGEGCRDLMFIGSLVRPALSEIRLDWGTLRPLGPVRSAFRGGDDHLLSGIGRIFEQDGFRMVGIQDVAPDLLMPEGAITRATPDALTAPISPGGARCCGRSSPFDIGQAAVVIDGHVVGGRGHRGHRRAAGAHRAAARGGPYPRQAAAVACW